MLDVATETLFALLEDKGYRRAEMGRLDRWYVSRVIFHPREPKTDAIDVKAHAEKPEPKDAYREMYLARGWPEWRIEAKAQERLMAKGAGKKNDRKR